MELISPAYRDLNQEAHQRYPHFGATSGRHAKTVVDLIERVKPATVLDYGAGKGTLGKEVRPRVSVDWREYDPAMPGIDAPPEPADLVICTDVLEHVEPDCLDAVLDDLRRVTKGTLLLIVATRFASHCLADGRNSHLIVEKDEWWLDHLLKRFKLVRAAGDERELACLLH